MFSFNLWQDHKLYGKTVFDLLDYLTSGWAMPLGGLGMAIFTGWLMSQASTREEIGNGAGYALWRLVIRYLTPVAIVLVFLNSIGLLG